MNEPAPGASLPYARLEPEFGRLCAILGWFIKSTAHWIPFERLVALHGWKRVLRAAERCEPGHRFPSDIEKVCREFAREEVSAAKQAAQDAEIAQTKAKAKATTSADWAAVVAKVKNYHPPVMP